MSDIYVYGKQYIHRNEDMKQCWKSDNFMRTSEPKIIAHF